MISAQVFAQTSYFIRGYVRDTRSSKMIPNVNVYIPGTRIGTATNAAGRFELKLSVNNPEEFEEEGISTTVQARKSGYKRFSAPLNFAIDERIITVTVPLEEDIFYDDESIETSFSAANQTRRGLGYSMELIPNPKVEATHFNSLHDLFKTELSSAHIIGTSGSIASGRHMLIRGEQTLFGSTNPTIYVDGIKFDSHNVSGGFNTGGQTVNRLEDINIEDVDRIEVLKGPASTALYGSEGANGVIQIFTKNGFPGQRTLNVSSQWEYRDVGSLEFPSVNTTNLIDQQTNTPYIWNNKVSIRGGQQDHQYYVSAKYITNNGILDNESIDGISLKSNFNFVMSRTTEFSIKSGFTRKLTRRAFGENSSIGPISKSMELASNSGKILLDLQETKLEQEVNKYMTGLHFIISPDPTARITATAGFDITEQTDALDYKPYKDANSLFQSNTRKYKTFTSRVNIEKNIEINPKLTTTLLFGTNFNSSSSINALNSFESVDGQTLPNLETLEQNAFLTPLADNELQQTILGVYGRSITTFNKWLTAEVGARYDKSKFAHFEYSNVFPFGSVNYIHKLNKKDYIKGFAGFGKAGRLLSPFESINFESFANNTLETSSEIELGAESTFLDAQFKSRVSFFTSTTSNAYLIDVQSSDKTIYSDGEIATTGIEFFLSGYPYRGEGFSYFTQFGFTSVTTKINSTGGRTLVLGAFSNVPGGGNAIIAEGNEGIQFYLPSTDGNGNLINQSSAVGNILPNIYGSFYNQFKVSDITIDIASNFAYGQKTLNLTKAYLDYVNEKRSHLYLAEDIESSGYFKIREVSVSYGLNLGAEEDKRLTLSLSLQNVATFTSYSGDDPEANAFSVGNYTNSGVDFMSLKAPRLISLRFKLEI